MVGVFTPHGTSSAAPMLNPEKWSHEAIVAFVKYATSTYAETHALLQIWGRIRALKESRV
jgi:hypothetical protein